jgi:V-type H+-transporting ATPase subunit E
LVQTEKKKMLLLHERREKQATVQKKIEYSNQLNLARLKVLKAQDDHLETIFSKANAKLESVVADQGKYTKLISSLLLQSCLSLCDEAAITVRCRKVDEAIVKVRFRSLSCIHGVVYPRLQQPPPLVEGFLTVSAVYRLFEWDF